VIKLFHLDTDLPSFSHSIIEHHYRTFRGWKNILSD
jgi:hypothetical protein